MDMKRILQAIDGAASKPVEGVDSMSKFLRVVKEGLVDRSGQPVQTGQPAAPTATPAPTAASTLSPEQLEYNRLRAQLDGADAIRGGGGANTFAVVSPQVTASTNAMKQKLAQMAAALKAKGIDAAAEYDAPEPGEPAAAPVDLNKKYANEEVGMSRFLSIISEVNSPLNKPSQATRETITSNVLNVAKDAKPSMIGKYFKTVENEFAESTERTKTRATQLAERVIERIVPNADGSLPDPSINRLTGKPNEPAAPAAPAPAGPTLSSRYGPGYEGSPAAYTIKVNGKDYKFAGRDKTGPGTGEIVKVPGGAVGIRGLAPVAVEIGQDGMFYLAPKTEAISKDDAYTRDYKSSISGMDKKSSFAYQQDGGANDEGDDEDFSRAQREREQGPWYLRINGKVYKQQGTPKEFSSKKGANNYALAILKKRPEMQGKIMLTKGSADQ